MKRLTISMLILVAATVYAQTNTVLRLAQGAQQLYLLQQSNGPALPGWYVTMGQRLQQEDLTSAQKDVTTLADIYEKQPENRVPVAALLLGIAVERQGIRNLNDTTEAYKPIVPTLIGHLFDGDRKAAQAAVSVFAVLWPPPFEILQPMIDLSHMEMEPSASTTVLARFCMQSKQAVLALRDAAASDQPIDKRVAAIKAMAEAANLGCQDRELIGALSNALKSNVPTEPIVHEEKDANGRIVRGFENVLPNVVEAAAQVAPRFGAAAAPLKADLERIAADQGHPLTAQAAKDALKQLQR